MFHRGVVSLWGVVLATAMFAGPLLSLPRACCLSGESTATSGCRCCQHAQSARAEVKSCCRAKSAPGQEAPRTCFCKGQARQPYTLETLTEPVDQRSLLLPTAGLYDASVVVLITAAHDVALPPGHNRAGPAAQTVLCCWQI